MDMILIISLKTTAEIEITEQYVLRATSQTRFIGFFVKRDYVLSLQFIAMECVNIFFSRLMRLDHLQTAEAPWKRH